MLKKAILTTVLAISAALSGAATAPDDWTALIKASVKASRQGDLKAAENSLLKALLSAESFGPEDPRQAYTLDFLGTVYWQQKHYDDALKVYERALKAFDASGDSVSALASARRLAEGYEVRQRWTDAEPLWRRLKAVTDADAAADGMARAQTASDLGYNLARQQRHDEALALFDEVLRLRTLALGADSAEVAEVLSNQARIQLGKGDLKAAEALARRALEIDSKALGDDHAVLADDWKALAAVLKAAGKPEAAEAEAKAEALRQAKAKPRAKPRKLPAPEMK